MSLHLLELLLMAATVAVLSDHILTDLMNRYCPQSAAAITMGVSSFTKMWACLSIPFHCS